VTKFLQPFSGFITKVLEFGQDWVWLGYIGPVLRLRSGLCAMTPLSRDILEKTLLCGLYHYLNVHWKYVVL
jgi:hypothetical protein